MRPGGFWQLALGTLDCLLKAPSQRCTLEAQAVLRWLMERWCWQSITLDRMSSDRVKTVRDLQAAFHAGRLSHADCPTKIEVFVKSCSRGW